VSNFVELPIEQYSTTAFNNFDPAAGNFKIANARALMWFSQLAYEGAKGATIEAVRQTWNFASIFSFNIPKIDIVASFDTMGMVGERADAIVLAFAGTDPAVWETLATDFNIRLTPDMDTHIGFQTEADAARPEIIRAITMSKQTGKPLLIAGHSLGAALAALAARFAADDGAAPKAIYAFGMPRAGGQRFQAAYNGDGNLGPVTYRLVYGLDVVARVPMSAIGYRHVGRELECESGKKFDAERPFSELGSDAPEFSLGLAHTLASEIGGLISGHILSPSGPGTFGPLFKYLPQPIRDHLQDSYYNALA
jgi:triacylglycerol lipase